MMKEDQFWKIIDLSREKAKAAQTKRNDEFAAAQERALREVLLRLTPKEVIAFDLRMRTFFIKAYKWDLWGAAYWLDGGCSDDGFSDFRYCLVSLGKDFYNRILANPDVLVETMGRVDMPYMQSEGFGYVAGKVYRELTGKAMPDRDSEYQHPSDPSGTKFDFNDSKEMRRHFPRLVERLPNGGP